MNKSIVLASLIFASTSLMATETKWFVGADVSRATISGSVGLNGTVVYNGVTYTNAKISGDLKDTSFDIKVGAIMDDSHRVYLNYGKNSATPEALDEKADLTNVTLNYDYLFSAVNNFTPYVGAHVGQSKLDVYEYSDSAMSYGAQVGLLYSLTNNIQFEAGVSYTKLDVTPTTPTVTGSYYGATLTNASVYLEADDMTKMYAGFNYKF